MSQLHGVLEPLEWESQFFGLSSAVVRFRDNAPALTAADFAPWQRVQAKIPAADADCLDALQQVGFQLVEGEVDLKMAITLSATSDAERATEQDIPALRQVAAVPVAKVVDTVGAGDAFAVGVLSALLEGRELPQAVARGNWCGSRAVQSRGDMEGLPLRRELEEHDLRRRA